MTHETTYPGFFDIGLNYKQCYNSCACTPAETNINYPDNCGPGILGLSGRDTFIHLYCDINADIELLTTRCSLCDAETEIIYLDLDDPTCQDEIGVCEFSRLRDCKAPFAIPKAANYCSKVIGQDLEQRCCERNPGFQCKKGECDYSYSLVSYEYTVSYEVVRKAYFCYNLLDLPTNVCSNYYVYDACNFKSAQYCTGEQGLPLCWPDCNEIPNYTGWSKIGDKHLAIYDIPRYYQCDVYINNGNEFDASNNYCAACVPCGRFSSAIPGFYDGPIYGRSIGGGWVGNRLNHATVIGSNSCGIVGLPCPQDYIWPDQMPQWKINIENYGTSRAGPGTTDQIDYCRYYPITAGYCCNTSFVDGINGIIKTRQWSAFESQYLCFKQVDPRQTDVTNISCGTNCGDYATYKVSADQCGYTLKFQDSEMLTVNKFEGVWRRCINQPEFNYASFVSCVGLTSDPDALEACRRSYALQNFGREDKIDCPKTREKTLWRTVSYVVEQIIKETTASVRCVYCRRKAIPCSTEE